MYQQFVPRDPIDRIREGMPNLRHGTKHCHPLEIELKNNYENEIKMEYFSTAALFGSGFANHIQKERKVIASTEIAYQATRKPNKLGLEISTGDIDEIDFVDMFAPNGMRSDLEFDTHEIHEKRFFK